MLHSYVGSIKVAPIIYILFVILVAYLAYYFGRKVERWEYITNTISAGVWIKFKKKVNGYTYVNEIPVKISVPKGRLAKIIKINDRNRLWIKLKEPIYIDDKKVKDIFGIKGFSNFKIIPEIILDEEFSDTHRNEVKKSPVKLY